MYFVNSATINGLDIEKDDLIIAYNDNVIVGSRYWYGEATDVPAMGSGYSQLPGYCVEGDEIEFKIRDHSEQKLVDMYSDIKINWSANGLNLINLSDMQIIPEKISFGHAYPNPFNPTTMLTYDIPKEMNVEIIVYDMNGRLVSELYAGMHEPGRHELHWDASHQSSGIYFVTFESGSHRMTQKLMLIK